MTLEELIIENIKNFLYDKTDIVKDIILEDYDRLAGFVIDKRSSVDINLYRGNFKSILDKFDFVIIEDGQINFTAPATDSLDFSSLNIIHQILEGIIGEYLEVDIGTINKLSNVSVSNRIPIDNTDVYLLKSTNELRDSLKNIGGQIIVFPFSSIGPLDDFVFEQAHKYVDSNMDTWIEKVIESTKKTMEQGV